MADGLFDLLEKRIYKVTDDFKGDLKSYLRRKKNQTLSGSNDWQLIYDQATQSKNYINLETSIQQNLVSNVSLQHQFSDTAINFNQQASQTNGSAALRPHQPKFEWGSTQTQILEKGQDQMNIMATNPLELTGLKIQNRQERRV